ncbi:MAG: type II secretion system protein F [Legionellales bacterium]|nr:type II secretion system protein F [Legionellales bacterium]|tara:strand:- start:48181 stop:49407 length:1227 start_codon:yes stop_codon:yes gene_type:complete
MADKSVPNVEVFLWEGTNKRGAKITGEITGTSMAIVKAELRRQGINPSKVRKKPKALFSDLRKQKIKPVDIAIVTRQLSTMINASVPIVQSIEILGRGHENPKMQELLIGIKNDVEAGNALSLALGKHPEFFNELFTNLVAAGEQSGSLDTMLDRIALYKEKTESLKGKIKKALFYPTAVIVIALVITAAMLIFVVPQFKEIFEGFGATLPAPTVIVMNLSEIFQSYWYIIFGVLFGGVYGIIKLKKTNEKFAHWLDKISLKIPIIGKILRKAAVARFARTLSTTFAAGMPLVDALEAVSGATGNILYKNATLDIRDAVSTGQNIHQSMRTSQLFPNMVVQMVAIGEESGSLEAMLSKVADFFEEEVDNAVDSLSSLLEPMIMVVLGVLIGGLVIAMYLPIFKMGSVI